MRTVEVSDIGAFLGEVQVLDLLMELVIFRGQAPRGGLLPTIARDNPRTDTTKIERSVLAELRRVGGALLPSTEVTDLDLLVRAQHFGLRTRLLDWTSNPLAALWFACRDRKPGPVHVYALEADDLVVTDAYSTDPFAQKETRVVQPRLNNPRIMAQHGWFTLHKYHKPSGSFTPLEKHGAIGRRLHEFRIPSDQRFQLLQMLDRLGVNASTMFPDLTGLCAHLNWRHLGA